ncbi:MAG: hypothetical protein AAFU79_31845 [Myxococcota bacterium]
MRRVVGWGLWGATGLVLALAWSWPSLSDRLWGAPGEMRPGCDPEAGFCPVAFEDGAEVRLRVETSTLPRRKRHFGFFVEAPGLEPSLIELSGVEMNMGLFRLPLHPGPGAVWTATAPLPLCTLKQMSWRADVRLGDRRARFFFRSERP